MQIGGPSKKTKETQTEGQRKAAEAALPDKCTALGHRRRRRRGARGGEAGNRKTTYSNLKFNIIGPNKLLI